MIARAARILLALPLAAGVAAAVTSPQVTVLAAIASLTVAALTFWRPSLGLLLVAGLAPAGRLFAPAPLLAAELFAWSFLAAWLLAVWRPLTPGTAPRARLTIPAAYLLAATASWLALTVGGAAGVPIDALPSFVVSAVPRDYLVFSSEQAETRMFLQTVAGVALLLAAATITAGDRRVGRAVAGALVLSAAVMAVATLGDVGRQWAGQGYGTSFLLRYVRGERFSLHLPDLNAAGSLYALAALCAVTFALLDRRRRWQWTATAVVMAPAAFLAGSRTSFVAFGAGLILIAGAVSKWRPTRHQQLAAIGLVGLVAIAGVLAADWSTDVRGAAGRSVSLRTQFTQSSLQMIRTEPVYGVGIGKYFDRSGEFFTPELRQLYGNENAHNYFLQQFAELGAVGGLLFLGVVLPPLFLGWRAVRNDPDDAALIALFAGTAAYLLTCVTGHPLLVPEAAFPFWIALGTLAASPANPARSLGISRGPALAAAVMALLLIGNVALAGRRYAAVATAPGGYGFHEEEAADEVTFRWMTRHAVAYIEDGPGFLRLKVKAPARTSSEAMPFVLETAIAGRVVDRRELPFGQWATFDLPVREAAGVSFRRVDLRLNQISWEAVTLGTRAAERPIGVMVSEILWMPLE